MARYGIETPKGMLRCIADTREEVIALFTASYPGMGWEDWEAEGYRVVTLEGSWLD